MMALMTAQGLRHAATREGKPVEAWTSLPLRFAPAPAQRELTIKGSDTIGAALGPAWAEALERAHPALRVRVEALGSNTGFAGLLDGSAAVAASSRPVRSDELAFAERLGVQLREVVVGYDGIAVIVHPDGPIRELELETLAAIFVFAWQDDMDGDGNPLILVRNLAL